ncbi:MAG: iron-sulfur cluster assembly accessory protein [Verrucomicrobia bacterium]|nr:iron-sulfur cluster assembly accessory protein [Verrucomicrobiota bacterium]
MIAVTESAVRHLQDLVADNPQYRDKGLRILVEKGGCAGMQYVLEFDRAKEGDHRVRNDGVEVLIDSLSAEYLKGSTVDFTDGLTGAGFTIRNPNAARSCGCGTSFEIVPE